jgi:hypothetical protein
LARRSQGDYIYIYGNEHTARKYNGNAKKWDLSISAYRSYCNTSKKIIGNVTTKAHFHSFLQSQRVPNHKTSFLTLFSFLRETADTFGLALILFEVFTKEQPFKGYKRLEFAGGGPTEEDQRPLTNTLDSYMKKYADNEFAMWLLEWVAYPSTRSHAGMLIQLKEWKSRGIKIMKTKAPYETFK